MATITVKTLFHGSNEVIAEIKDQGLFGGLFATGRMEAALSHGDNLHAIKLADDEVLTQQYLSYEADANAVRAVIAKATRCSEADIELAWDIIVEGESAFEADEEAVLRIFRADDLGEASWEAQRIRGLIAKAMGFRAVEMNDEHGTTFLVLPGVEIKAAAI